MTGRITELIRSRACGFMRAANGQNVFFHASDLQGTRYDALEVGQTLEFELITDAVSGPRAASVRVSRRNASKATVSRKSSAGA